MSDRSHGILKTVGSNWQRNIILPLLSPHQLSHRCDAFSTFTQLITIFGPTLSLCDVGAYLGCLMTWCQPHVEILCRPNKMKWLSHLWPTQCVLCGCRLYPKFLSAVILLVTIKLISRNKCLHKEFLICVNVKKYEVRCVVLMLKFVC